MAGPIVLGLLLLLLPLTRGGIDGRALLAIVLMASVALWLACRSEMRVPPATLVLLGVLTMLVVQVVPWPVPVHRLAPSTRALFETTLKPIGLYPSARPLSLDPPATALEVAKASAGLAAFLVGWLAGGGRRSRAVLLGSLAATGMLTALLTIGGALFGLPLLSPRFPLVNPNHLAGLLSLTAFVTLGLALRARGQAKLLWMLGFMGMTAVLFASLSRGGIGAYLGGAGLFAFLGARRESQGGEQGRPSRLAFAAGVAGALALAAYVAFDQVLQGLQSLRGASDEVKISFWRPALQMAWDYPLFGIGRGAFQTAFPSYKTEVQHLTFTHLENEWLQPLAELGIPLGTALVVTLAATWVGAVRRRDLTWPQVGLLTGTATLALQNLVDFSLEIPGVAVPFMTALGLAGRGMGGIRLRRATARSLAIVLAAGGAAGIGSWWANGPGAEPAPPSRTPSGDEVVAAARAQAARRPADFLPQALAGIRLVEEDRCHEALPWLTRAMLLNPTAPEPHRFAARCLASAGQTALARREYRLAWSYGLAEVLPEAADRFPALEDLLQIAPDSAGHLLNLGEFLLTRRPSDAALVLRRVVDEYGDGRAIPLLAQALRASGDLEGALEVAKRRTSETPGDPSGWRVSAEILLGLGREEESIQVVRRGLAFSPGAPLLQGFLVERSMAGRRFSEARRLAEEMACRTATEVSTRFLLVARALAAQGRLLEAIDQARSAAAALPGAPGPLLAVAGYCEQAGRLDDAIAAVEQAAGLPNQVQKDYSARLEALSAAKASQLERRMLDGLRE